MDKVHNVYRKMEKYINIETVIIFEIGCYSAVVLKESPPLFEQSRKIQ